MSFPRIAFYADSLLNHIDQWKTGGKNTNKYIFYGGLIPFIHFLVICCVPGYHKTKLNRCPSRKWKIVPKSLRHLFKCNSILGNNKSPVVGVAVDNKWPNERQRARRWSRSSPVQFPYYVEYPYPAPSSIIASLDHMNQPTESSMNSD